MTRQVSINRRSVLAGGLAAPLSATLTSPTLADTSNFVRPAGVYSTAFGDSQITIISDGQLNLGSAEGAFGTPDVNAILAARHLPTDNVVGESNLMLIETAGKRTLIDTGSGANWQPTAGHLPAGLAAIGLTPSDIDRVIITHGHPDHAWGLISNQGPVFPNARIQMPEVDFNFWMDAGTRALFPEAFKGLVDGTQAILGPLEGQIERVAMSADLGGGLKLIPSAGHTPGHVSVMLTSAGRDLLILADVAIHPIISLERPDIPFAFDVDPETAIATRRTLLAQAAGDGLAVLSYHWPFPGLGHVFESGNGSYRYEAAVL